MKKLLLCVFFLIFLNYTSLFSAAKSFDHLFFSRFYDSLQIGIVAGAEKHAIYTYILANASTPGLDLVQLLPPKDQKKLMALIPPGADVTTRKSVVMEFVLTQMSYNQRRMAMLTTIWGNKGKSLTKIVTLGK